MAGSKLDYHASVESRGLKDEAALSVSEDGLVIVTLFRPVYISFADIVSFERQNYTVVIQTDDDRFVFSKLGSYMEAFYLELYEAFNRKVRRALFVKGDPELKAEGEFRYSEGDCVAQGRARIQVFDDCVCLLPPDGRARRIPFAFMNGLRKENFELTLSLEGGDRYSFIRLGYDSDAFEAVVKEKLRRLRENALHAARALDGGLNPAQLSAIAARMPQGVAIPMGQLRAAAPSYVKALEAKIGASRAAGTYAAFKEICDPDAISVGMKSGLAGEREEDILWFIAPSAHDSVAAVELALDEESSAATYLYNIGGDRADFVRQLNRAMEAIDFRREVISLPEEKLKDPQYDNYAMAVKRTASLRFLRACFAGRVIHSDTWKSEMRRQMCDGISG